MSEETAGILDGAVPPARNPHLYGHRSAEDFLARSYRSGKGHHAILIEGPEGIGKATLAFRFANHVLTHPDPEAAPDHLSDPDPNSPVSRQIASGASHNLLHLTRPVDEKTGKAKTAITVDEVRRAGHFFSQTSGTGNWRIVIIDPADDLNRNAANAILKILEEPPRRALFIVLSHAPGKLLPTIRSRCQSLKLSPLSDEDLSKALAGLGMPLEGGRTEEIVLSMGKGSVAQALKLLNYGGTEIIAAFNEVIAADGPTARKAMHRLADVLSGKESDVIFGFFLEHLSDYLVARAREAAFAGDLPAADRQARLVSDIAEKITVAQAYNLDRKQTILSILEAARR
ncbi:MULTISPECIES: DNA polymerase III subunit delta' [Rhizobium/Agrobacterium group]|uniref:DNA polymerase III subunit delta n=2 Tax=Neorhizobium TaxID=1525371 RepID=A0ABV0M189_9HYPH|nr:MULTISPECIES: DNA polymerase III subunit delta' [Rhizobium/Agrobacterium group]KGE00563.1 DNA polymerase III subunit delta' [Rhizobium sp. YS-1r]MCC2610155.1 DNA polymerase III subunit delta' [Neorhizobium petrolearium]WGI70324.1 DNA polymerase III subunit delta' [Neorhizobium petrolearium]